MAYFVVTYDLIKKKPEDYKELWDAFAALNAQKYQKSCWFVECAGTAMQLKTLLATHIDKEKDYLMIVRFATRPSWTKALKGTAAWADARFPQSSKDVSASKSSKVKPFSEP